MMFFAREAQRAKTFHRDILEIKSDDMCKTMQRWP